MPRRIVVLVAALAALPALVALDAGSLRAQDTATAVRPGMSESDVRARWGEPVAVRRANEWTYLFFRNGLERQWGYYDTVFLHNDQVVDAIVRAPEHLYVGQSSSPPDRLPEFTPPGRPPTPGGAAGVLGVRLVAPGPTVTPTRERR